MLRIQKYMLGLLIVVLLFTNLTTMNKLTEVSSDLRNLRNEMNRIESELAGVNSNIFHMNQKEKLIAGHNYYVNNADSEFKNAKVRVDMQFGKLPGNAKAYLLYQDYKKGEQVWNTIELINIEGLNYYVDLELSYDGNYNMQVVVESGEGKQTENLPALDLEQKLSGRIDLQAMPDRADSTGNMTYHIIANNYFENNDKLKLKSIRGFVRYKDKVIEEIDVMDRGTKQSSSPDSEQWIYKGSVTLKEVSNMDYMKDVSIEIIAIDGFSKEYTHKFQEPK